MSGAIPIRESSAADDASRVSTLRWLEAGTGDDDDWLAWSTRTVARTLRAPVAWATWLEPTHERVRSAEGVLPGTAGVREVPFTHSICRVVVERRNLVMFENGPEDSAWRDHPAVREFGVRAYIGAPLRARGSTVVGALCAMDTVPRSWGGTAAGLLEDLANAVSQLGDLRATLHWRNRAVSMLAHEAKTQLQTLMLSGEHLLRRMERSVPRDAANDRARMTRAMRRTRMVLDDVLDMAQWIAGTLALRPGHVDLTRLAREAAEDHQARTRRHSIRVEIAAAPVSGTWDEARLGRVIDNLLSNAIKYSPMGGDVTIRVGVRAGQGGPRAVLTVVDHGIGIAPSEVPYVFEGFFRGAEASRVALGCGLGLASSRDIVRLHGGEIRATPTAGGGTTMIVELPFEPPSERERPQSGPRRIVQSDRA